MMRFSRALSAAFVFPLVLVAAACSRAPAPLPEVASASPSSLQEAASPAPPPKSSAPAPKPSSPVVVTEVGPGTFELTSSEETSLASALELERASADTFEKVEGLDAGKGLTLATSCAAPPASCVTLAKGIPLVPVAWTGLTCAAQCNASCRAEAPAAPGAYRVAVRACGGARFAELPFTVPKGPIEGIPRVWAGTSLVAGVVARLGLPRGKPGWDMTEPRAKGDVAGMPETSPERPVDATSLTKLSEILKKEDGFDDRIMKRCLMSQIVGFRLTRDLATTGPARRGELEVVLSLGCAKIFVVTEPSPGKRRVVHASHFDPQREAVAALVRGLFPEAKDLARR